MRYATLINSDFWSTSAQTMPVLALAIVVEARAVMSKWQSKENRLLHGVLGFGWAIPLILYGLSIPQCLLALSGRKVWDGWVQVIAYSVEAGVAVLILAPASQLLVRANSRPAAYAASVVSVGKWVGMRRLQITFSDFTIRRQLKRNLVRLDRAEIEIRYRRQNLVDTGLSSHPKFEKWTTNLSSMLSETLRLKAEQLKLLHKVESIKRESSEKFTEMRRQAADIYEGMILGIEDGLEDPDDTELLPLDAAEVSTTAGKG